MTKLEAQYQDLQDALARLNVYNTAKKFVPYAQDLLTRRCLHRNVCTVICG